MRFLTSSGSNALNPTTDDDMQRSPLLATILNEALGGSLVHGFKRTPGRFRLRRERAIALRKGMNFAFRRAYLSQVSIKRENAECRTYPGGIPARAWHF